MRIVLSNQKLLDQSLERGGQMAAVVQVVGKLFTCSPDNWKPFQLAWMRESNVADALKLGHYHPVQIDATFGSNNLKFPLSTLLAVDDFGKGIPFAWMVASREQTECITAFLAAVRERVRRIIL